jgi:hypothetical protein
MGSQFELFSRAAVYDRLLKATNDPVKQQRLRQLREVWISLANESPHMSAETVATEIARIEKIEAHHEEGEKKPL